MLKMGALNSDTDIPCCASCGIAEINDIKLKECNDCGLVRYCSDECQHNHKSEHEAACKKRAAELRDELLFKQPESTHEGDCPICCLPMPLYLSEPIMYFCCSKIICSGCAHHANKIRRREMRRERLCPFCREPVLRDDDAGTIKRRMKRVAANDPEALCNEGMVKESEGDYSKAFEYYTKAAELGVGEAHYRLAFLYGDGKGVQKDKGKKIFHFEEAAIGGHPFARYLLGGFERSDNNNAERAVKHDIIAATQGVAGSIDMLMEAYKKGLISKDVLATTLRANQAAVDAMKSPQREAAKKALEKWRKRA